MNSSSNHLHKQKSTGFGFGPQTDPKKEPPDPPTNTPAPKEYVNIIDSIVRGLKDLEKAISWHNKKDGVE